MLALCSMRTLYLRNVPDDVVDRLERLAKLEGISINAVAIRELAEGSRRIDNAALLGSLPHRDITLDQILENLEQSRSER
jgi:hypothetical protein